MKSDFVWGLIASLSIMFVLWHGGMEYRYIDKEVQK